MEDTQFTEFNMNQASLIRVDTLLKNCYVSRFENNMESLYKNLENLRMECYYKMTGKWKDKRKELETIWTGIEKTYNLSKKNDSSLIKIKLNKLLDDYWMSLMDFMGERGMLLKDERDTRGL